MCDIYGAPWHAVTPFNNHYSTDCFGNTDSPFAQSKNKYREKGSPWHKPLVGVMQPRDLPLILTKYATVLTHLIIIFSHFSSKTIFCIIFSKHPHSTQSYTLLIQFQSHLSLLTIHILTNMVHCFKGYQHIINNKAVTHKGTLVFTLMWGNKRFSLLAKTL